MRSKTFNPAAKAVYARVALAAVLVLLLALGIAPGRALAHAKVASSTPANGSTVQAGLTQIVINFSEDVSPTQSNAQLLKGDGSAVASVTTTVNRADRKVMTIKTPALGEGVYQVKWHAVTEDDNGISDGTINFTVGNGSNSCVTFKETGKSACGQFLAYWNGHGGLAQQGFPISGEMQEKSDTDGKTYTVQYFERAVFEQHPENAAPYDVLLSQLGTFRYNQKYGTGPAGTPQARNAVNVDIVDFKFAPDTITVPVGTKVTWTWVGPTEHNTVSKANPKLWESPIMDQKGQTYSYTFTKAGTYDYWCTIHPDMLGRVIVK